MKLRLLGNSIRLRLSQGEVARIGSGQAVSEEVTLAPQVFRYELRVSESGSEGRVEADFAEGCMVVRISAEAARRWAGSADVGIYSTTTGGIKVSIEKDFKCLHGSSEPQADCYPNPREKKPD